jgi:hypothetical protein
MKPSSLVIPTDKIAAFCRRNRIRELAPFGSALRNDFRPDSDMDVLVTFAPNAKIGLFELAAMEEELQVMLGRKVDLAEKPGLRNPFRRHEILRSMDVIYAS